MKKIGSILAFILGLTYTIFAIVFDSPPVGTSQKTDKSLIDGHKEQPQLASTEIEMIPIQNEVSPVMKKSNQGSGGLQQSKLEYRAKQVLVRSDDKSSKKALPNGSNIIGKLLSAIDSRDLTSQVKVLLPYGANFKGEQFIEKNSMLIGKANYSGKGERIYLTFDKSISPTGEEKPIMAIALDSADYSNGVIGEVHSETGIRIAGTLGLTMVSSMTDVLTEKTAHGDFGATTPKPTMRNAVFQGVSKVTDMEAARHADAMAQTPPYITLEAGTDLIISLTSAFGGENE